MEYLIIVASVLAVIFSLLILSLRRVVSTNEVHIVQSGKRTESYGKDKPNGNVYYEWPSWLPIVGVNKIILPVSVFSIPLDEYEAYDKGRVPFVVDIVSFFRIDDSNQAAERIASFHELEVQLKSVVQGAVRTTLAQHDLDTIMVERSTFGDKFTSEVSTQLKDWGVVPVKNIELMDIRDTRAGTSIASIMNKKKSLIEMESRSEVAENLKKAKIAEIEATQETDIRQQEAIQRVGERQAETAKLVGVAQELSNQEIKLQQKLTKEREMEVTRVGEVKSAEISKDVNVVKAEQEKQVQVLTAEGRLEAKKLESEGITLEGTARAEAEKAMQLAPVTAQTTLAKEIGENKEYQKYLVTIRQIEASQVVGVEQAKALTAADVKIITNAGDPPSGMNKVTDLFSSKGGTDVASMLEGVMQSDVGKALLSKFASK